MPGMQARNFDMQVIAPRVDDLPVDELVDGIATHRIEVGSSAELVAAAYDYFRQIDVLPDVVQVMVPAPTAHLLALVRFKRRGITCILTFTMVNKQPR